MKNLALLIFFLFLTFESFSDTGSTIKKHERVFLKDTLSINSFLWAGRIIYVRNKDSKIFDTNAKKWGKNILNPEINDGDSFATNYLYHPYFGALYYQVYRDLGYDKNDAFLGTIIQSTLWEFTIEGTVEKPSIIDLVVTPGLGIPLGLYFEKINIELYESDSKLKKTLSYLINPARLFFDEGNLGFINPLTKTFMIYKPFSYRDHSGPDKFLSLSGISVNSHIFNVKQYRGGGVDILYSLRANFVNTENNLSLRFRFPWAGAYDGNDKDYNVVDNGFEIGNTEIGLTKLVIGNENIYAGYDLALNLPTTSLWGDKKNRLEKLHSNSLIIKDVLHNSTILSPKFYIGNNLISFSFSSEIFLNSQEYSDDSEELFLVYDTKISLFKSVNKKYNLDFDLKFLDKKTEEDSNVDGVASVRFTIVDDLDLSFEYIEPFYGDIDKYIYNGVFINLKLPLS